MEFVNIIIISGLLTFIVLCLYLVWKEDVDLNEFDLLDQHISQMQEAGLSDEEIREVLKIK